MSLWIGPVLRKINHKVEKNAHLRLACPGDVEVSSLASPGMVPVHILTPKAKETVHAQIQASFTFLERRHKQCLIIQPVLSSPHYDTTMGS